MCCSGWSWFDQAQQEITEIDILDGALSAATFLPTVPRSGGFRGLARRVAIRRQLEDAEAELVAAQFLQVSENEQSWRISARVQGLKDFDYNRFLDRLREKVSPLIAEQQKAGYQGMDATYTGVTSVVYEAERVLLSDLFNSFLTALACVTVIMMAALRSVRAGLIAMVPNVFPMLILFGGMGWFGWTVGIGTVMTASVALGIAVDGTFHFLKWFRHEVELGRSPRQAVAYSYQHCGRAGPDDTDLCLRYAGVRAKRFSAGEILFGQLAASVDRGFGGRSGCLAGPLVGRPDGQLLCAAEKPRAECRAAPPTGSW